MIPFSFDIKERFLIFPQAGFYQSYYGGLKNEKIGYFVFFSFSMIAFTHTVSQVTNLGAVMLAKAKENTRLPLYHCLCITQ